MDRWTPRAAPVRNSRHRGHPAPPREDYNVVIRSASGPAVPLAARTLTAMGRALVLNATELPLAVVPARRAVVLVLKEKAEVVQSNGAIFHSERIALEAPSVVRLRHFVHVPFRAHAPLTRRAVFARDGWQCQYCGATAENVDHVVPKSRGGLVIVDGGPRSPPCWASAPLAPATVAPAAIAKPWTSVRREIIDSGSRCTSRVITSSQCKSRPVDPAKRR